jgi:ElaB/YqjD/DUF883 family membrane-anchored ribosome-binding protein
MEQVTTEKLMADLRIVIGDAEELLKATAGQAGAKVDEARARAQESLRAARERLEQAGAAAGASMREIDAQVRANPWAAVGIAAGVGLVIGVLLARR